MIRENLAKIEANIQKACEHSGRKREDITLIVVSKTQSIDTIKEAYDASIRVFGENRVQELNEKYALLPDDIKWHMIGHLQTNKVKPLIGKVELIHSVDSVRLAETINKEAAKQNVVIDILVEVNVAREGSKFGFALEDVVSFVETVAKMPHIRARGLMTIAPFVDNPEDNREVFKALRKLLVDINDKNIDNIAMGVLSMGMTNDYEVAIEEGATMVRIGTAVFGERV